MCNFINLGLPSNPSLYIHDCYYFDDFSCTIGFIAAAWDKQWLIRTLETYEKIKTQK